MKKITLLGIAFIAFAFSFQANAQCDYTIELSDSWGDGWNGVSNIDVLVNGVVVLDDIVVSVGAGTLESFTISGVMDGDDITTVFNPVAVVGAGDYAEECGYRILDNIGGEVYNANFTGAAGPPTDAATGTITVACQACVPATGVATVNTDCANNQFFVDVDVTDLGDNTTVFIVDSSENILGQTTILEVVTVGPFPEGISMDLYFKHDSNVPACDVLIGSFLDDCLAPECADTPTPAIGAVDVITAAGAVTIAWVPSATGEPADDYDVYWGTAPGVLVLIGTTPNITVDITGLDFDTTYYWTIVPSNIYGDASGCAEWSFTTESAPPAPANDACDSAISLACDDVVPFDTTFATLDNDVTCGTSALSNNIWYTYQGTGTPETITLSTCSDADYDTKLFVYSGDCGSLVCVANNDDFTGCTDFSSQLEFVSDGTTIFRISVNGYNNATGTITSEGSGNLTVSCGPAPTPPANNTCDAATGLTMGTTLTDQTNVNAWNAVNNPSCDPFGTISDVWFSFVAPASMAVDITTTLGTASDAKFAVFTDCGVATELGCSLGGAANTLHIQPVTTGVTYYIQVWNDGSLLRSSARTEGTFDILVEEGVLSTEDFDEIELFTYYPNPVNNTLTLKAQRDIQNVSIYNMLGQEVLRTAPNAIENDVDMSTLQSGAYFVKVTIDDISETVRIIKKLSNFRIEINKTRC